MTTAKKFVCPECNEKFAFPQVLGRHRLQAHGIAGSSDAARKAQAKKARQPPEPTEWPCADCDFIGKTKGGLTIHRKAQHGRVSQSATAVAIRTSDPLQCAHCEFHAINVAGLALHGLKKHGIVSHRRSTELKRLLRKAEKQKGLPIEPAQTVPAVAITTNGHHPSEETHFAPNGIPQGTLALALGRFQELCRSVATEHDLPPRSFAAELARLIYATTLR